MNLLQNTLWERCRMLESWIRSITSPGMAGWTVWVMRGLCVLVVVVGCVLAAYGASLPRLPGPVTLVWFVMAVTISLYLGQVFHTASRRVAQRARDLEAERVYDAIRTGTQTGAFILYLRPFASTDALADQRVSAVRMGQSGLVIGADRLEFEGDIQSSVGRYAPMIALGEPLEHEGAGRIAVPEGQWQTSIEALMDAAALILLLPSPRAGTLWEIDQLIANGHLAKTLIIDPPNHRSSRDDYDPVTEWCGVQIAFAQRGLALPDDHREGHILTFPMGKGLVTHIPGGLDLAARLGAIVKERLDQHGTGPGASAPA